MHDQALVALSKAKNNLETFIYDLRDKLEHDSKYKLASTASERSAITEKLTEIDAWLWDDGATADVKVDDNRILHSCWLTVSRLALGIAIEIRRIENAGQRVEATRARNGPTSEKAAGIERHSQWHRAFPLRDTSIVLEEG